MHDKGLLYIDMCLYMHMQFFAEETSADFAEHAFWVSIQPTYKVGPF